MSTQASDTPATRDEPVLPPADLRAMAELSRFLELSDEPAVLLGPDGEQMPLPIEIYEVLVRAAEAMKAGKAVTLSPHGQRLTTQQAADLLGISRPTLVKLLKQGEIPYEQPADGRHRRMRLRDVLAYRDRRREDRRTRLAEATRQAVEDGLYEVDAADYEQALNEARQHPARDV